MFTVNGAGVAPGPRPLRKEPLFTVTLPTVSTTPVVGVIRGAAAPEPKVPPLMVMLAVPGM